MPPRLQQLQMACSISTRPTASLSSFLLPFLHTQTRHASILSSLSDNPSAYNKRIRRGRGPSSGKGKTSGRGHKGQKQHGKVPAGFQGGQTPLEIVKGKRGFDNVFSVEMSPLNVDRLQSWVDQGRLDPSKPITMKELVDSRCLHRVKDGVKLLGRGASELRTAVNVLVSRASASAIAAVEAAGGTVTTRYYTPFAIRRILRGQSEAGAAQPEHEGYPSSRPFMYRLPDPTSRKDIEYYRDSAHRGYLTHLVPEGEGPSLFFRAPGKGRSTRKKAVTTVGGTSSKDNRVW